MERIITTAKEQNSTPLITSIQYLIKVYFIRFNSPVYVHKKAVLSQTYLSLCITYKSKSLRNNTKDNKSELWNRLSYRGGVIPKGPPLILADQLTLSQPRGADYSHHIHSVAKVYAVLPFYDVKCLCSGGRE